MKYTILHLVKFFEREEYADQFLQGKLYLNRLSYFKSLESNQTDGRPDRNEAIAMWLQKERVSLEFKDHPELNIAPENLAGPVRVSFNRHDDLHLLCMTARHTGEFELDLSSGGILCLPGELEDVRKQLSVHEECLKMGRFAIIARAAEFVLRVKEVVERDGYKFNSTLVQYFDTNTFHGNFAMNDIPFRKAQKFSYQSEHRIVVDTGTSGNDPMVLDIGDICDIAAKIPSDNINVFEITPEPVVQPTTPSK